MGKLTNNKIQTLPTLFLILLAMFFFGCHKKGVEYKRIDCRTTIENNFSHIIKLGEGNIDLKSYNCFKWDSLVIVEPFFNLKELNEITNTPLPPEMMSERTNENIYHLLFVDSKSIKEYIPVSSFQVSFSGLVTGKKCYHIIGKNDYLIHIYTSDEKMYKLDKFLIKAELIKK